LCYLPHPEVRHVHVVIKEDLLFLIRFYFEIPQMLFEIPFGISHKLKLQDVLQVYDNVGLVRELSHCFIADQYTFNWVQV
jgi:hypothetical protein